MRKLSYILIASLIFGAASFAQKARDYENLGNAYYKQQKYSQAAEAYRKAILLRSGGTDIFADDASSCPTCKEATCSHAGHQSSAACRQVDCAHTDNCVLGAASSCSVPLRKQPDCARAWFLKGCDYEGRGEYAEALAAWRKSVEYDSSQAEAYYRMGRVYYKLGRYQKAVEACRAATVCRPGYLEAYYCMGNALYEQCKYADAICAYQNALSGNPHYAQVHYNLGMAYGKKSMYSEAICAFENALRIEPGYQKARLALNDACRKIAYCR
ncbi:MAG: tetratricopeptide repeat protein [Tannerellaceae bacterium]|jgi:tetratricopeptide (TPR) repeat protein|nr:tetratricopeptide repeat protein [Tannerellaceae bacterium]